jgi:Protein of unknown function (DUF1553)/Protein of unknown function (DUF1549)/Planctomycete cytochrome C/Concanavalin A-like lectin/glucanases superfamily
MRIARLRHQYRRSHPLHLLCLYAALILCGKLHAAPSPQQIEFFESRIRPILAQECYECHSTATKQKAGLVLDSRLGWQSGGDSGAAIKPGDAENSLLIQTIKHAHEDMKMPKNGAKLDAKVIADFEQWIREGAIDPRDTPPSREQVEKETAWPAILERRKQWWAFQKLKADDGKRNSIDDFIEAELQKNGLLASPPADAQTLRRRLSYVITGLPESDWSDKSAPSDYTDALLTSPAFGEKWARHFLDWMRYAESYGSEGDPVIPYAYQYRDYLIRAFNDDVPYPQMIREAIAGDLLAKPRLKNGLNESAIGIAQLRMVLHGFSPVDSLDEMVTFTDNQIDTVTKAFQALTVSCARCHNHKFDAISQADFYALYGIFTSTHPAVIDVNALGTGEAVRAEMRKVKTQIKEQLITDWLAEFKDRSDRSDPTDQKEKISFQGLPRTKAGQFSVTEKGIRIHPSGYISDLISRKERSVIITDRFKNSGGMLWFRIAGNDGVKAKYVVQNYPRTGTIHKAVELKDAKDETLTWRGLDLSFWKEDEIFLQVATAADLPAESKDQPSWFVLNDVLITAEKVPPPPPAKSNDAPSTLIAAWKADAMSDAQAEALDDLVRSQKLPLNSVKPLLERYRELEAKLPEPTRVPGVIEANAKDAALFVRGDHKQLSEIIPRRFLDAIDPTPFQTKQSGRLELAEHMADLQNNPLTARVMVNRLWHHVFGRGLVASTDNFGKLGDLPTHPELLDFLAQRFIESGGSIKAMLKLMLSSKAFQRSSEFTVRSSELDPENKLLSHWSTRRLEAEAIRDSILTLSGKLEAKLYGESVSSAEPRRSVYVKVIRNALDPFLTTFDSPVPFSTRGKRDITNVPAQSLTLLNDPNVIRWSQAWALRHAEARDEERVRRMFQDAFQREASDAEVQQSLGYMKMLREESGELKRKVEVLNQAIADISAKAQASVRSDLSVLSDRSLPAPMAEWTFDTLRDSISSLHLKLTGSARLENGALVLDGHSMAESGPLPKTLHAKTLEAWGMLENLTQQGGGVLTVQDMQGDVFDSLVFGEKQAGHWVAGSDFFKRSELLDGPAETEAMTRPIHLAVVYQPDGKISVYREGKPYGRTFRKAPAAVFEANKSQVLLGSRHGKPTGNKALTARIFCARLYDRALTAEEIAKTARVESGGAADLLTDEQRMKLTMLQEQRQKLMESLPTDFGDASTQAWTSFAQSLINMKEFIYLR